MTKYRLSKKSGVPESSVIRVANGDKRPTDEIIHLLAMVEELDLHEEELLEWRLVDDYPEQAEVLKRAIRVRDDDSLVQEFLRRYSDPRTQLKKVQEYIRGDLTID